MAVDLQDPADVQRQPAAHGALRPVRDALHLVPQRTPARRGSRFGQSVRTVSWRFFCIALATSLVGIDASANQPRLLTRELAASAELLVTMGCGEECPVVAGVRRLDWPLRDPQGLPLDEVREIREEVRARVEELVRVEGLGQSAQ